MSGSVRLHGDELLGLSDQAMSRIRGKAIGTVFQDPMSALTPVYTVGDQIAEAIRVHHRDTSRSAAAHARRRTARPGRHRAARTAGAGLPARAVRRRAPARRHRDRDRQRPRPADLRRTDDRAGRHRAGADPRRAQDRARRHRRRRADHHPRPRGGRRVRRPCAGDVRRTRRRGRRGRGPLPRPPNALHRGSARLGTAPGRRRRAPGWCRFPVRRRRWRRYRPGCPFAPRCPLAIDECRAAEPDLDRRPGTGTRPRASAPTTSQDAVPPRSTACQRTAGPSSGTAVTRRWCCGSAISSRPTSSPRAWCCAARSVRCVRSTASASTCSRAARWASSASPDRANRRRCTRSWIWPRRSRVPSRCWAPTSRPSKLPRVERCAATCRWCSRIRSRRWTRGCRCST